MQQSHRSESSDQVVLRAGAAVIDAETILSRVEIVIAGGRIVSVGQASALSSAESELVLTAGFVNAHTHLDLGALAHRVAAGPSFLAWVGDVVAARGELEPKDVALGVRRSADALLATGTTCVIDIDATGAAAAVVEACALRTVELREVIDGSPAEWTERSDVALEAARAALARPRTERRAHGVSPHGTHTVSDALLAAVGALRPTVPVAVHWAETLEESEWLERGGGAFATWLGPSPRTTGTERLAGAHLLERSLLVHGNHPQAGEIERIAAAGATVVHCPGSHLFFRREPFSVRRFLAAGVSLALGTDSWASNDALDMRREMSLARETLGLSAVEVWRMATESGAACTPWPHVTGRLEVGAAADLAIFRAGQRSAAQRGFPDRILEHLTTERPDVVGLYVAGERVRG